MIACGSNQVVCSGLVCLFSGAFIIGCHDEKECPATVHVSGPEGYYFSGTYTADDTSKGRHAVYSQISWDVEGWDRPVHHIRYWFGQDPGWDLSGDKTGNGFSEQATGGATDCPHEAGWSWEGNGDDINVVKAGATTTTILPASMTTTPLPGDWSHPGASVDLNGVDWSGETCNIMALNVSIGSHSRCIEFEEKKVKQYYNCWGSWCSERWVDDGKNWPRTVSARQCNRWSHQQWKAKGDGKLRSVSFDKCLEAESATAGAALKITYCQENSALQNWHWDHASAFKLAEAKDESNDHLCLGMVGNTGLQLYKCIDVLTCEDSTSPEKWAFVYTSFIGLIGYNEMGSVLSPLTAGVGHGKVAVTAIVAGCFLTLGAFVGMRALRPAVQTESSLLEQGELSESE